MKKHRFSACVVLFVSLVFSGIYSCGSSDSNFAVTPAGPTVVFKSATQQFTSNESGTTWAVTGGAANGSIDASGLYTAPDILPLNPAVTITGTAPDGEQAGAAVNLRTANAIAFDPDTKEQVNDTVLSEQSLDPGYSFGGAPNFAVKQGSLKIFSVWNRIVDDNSIAGYAALALDLNPFGPEDELFSNSIPNIVYIGSAALDPNLNPVFLGQHQTSADIVETQVYRSTDGGATFLGPVVVKTNGPGESQSFGYLTIDPTGVYHVTLAHGALAPSRIHVVYQRSTDGGATWTGKDITPLSEEPVSFFSANAVSEDGQTVAICYNVLSDPVGAAPSSYSLVVSQDGGDSFSAPVTLDAGNGLDAPMPPGCAVKVAPGGQIYMAYSKANHVFLARSDDQGTTFATNEQVNAAAMNADKTQPYLAVDDQGRIDIAWSDTDDPSSDVTTTVSYARSTDQGQSFTEVPDLSQTLGLGGEEFNRVAGLHHDPSGRLFLEVFSGESNSDGEMNLFLYYAE